jgi:transcriptional regulator with XRE-family HTH domain
VTQTRTRKRRHVVVVDESALAKRIGDRLRAARVRRGLSQREVAGERYTSQYVSSLERGAVKPSMAALNYLADRLEVPVRNLLDQPSEPWKRIEADMKLAAGDLQEAADLYRDLLDAPGGSGRAEALRGLAEAFCRLNRAAEAISPAAEAAELFEREGRPVDAALAAYWLASAQYQTDNVNEARALLDGLLDRVRGGLHIESGFKIRLLTSLASVASWSGDYRAALGYLEEGRSLAEELDPRAQAAYFYSLAVNSKHAGDLEGAIQAGMRSLALYDGGNARLEIAALHNHLALTHLRLNNLRRASEFAQRAAGEAEDLGDDRALAGILDTQAQVALAEGRAAEALELADRARSLGDASSSPYAVLGGWLTRARALAAEGDARAAVKAFEAAASIVRNQGQPSRRREVLAEFADYLTQLGRSKQALTVYREALQP